MSTDPAEADEPWPAAWTAGISDAALLAASSDVMRGSSSSYRKALALAADIASRMPAEERSAWLRALRTEFRTKRNFFGGVPVA